MRRSRPNAAAPGPKASLTDAEWGELHALVEAQYGGQGLAAFIREQFPRQPPPRHVAPIINLFERARRERVMACVSLPPRHAKSTTIQRGIGWWLKRSPADTCAYASYNDPTAWTASRQIRDVARRVGIQLRDDVQNVGEWRTPEGGGLFARGLGGGFTSKGVSGLFVVDDPYKDREDLDSPSIKERIWERFTEAVYTRLEGASVLVVHTRWAEDDMIGRLATMGWEVLNLPAIAEENDPLGRTPGEALWPERFPVEELEKTRAVLGEWSFAALYQGRPRPRGAAVFGPAHYYDPATFDPQGCRIMIGGDPAASSKTRADHSVALALAVRGYGADAMGYLLDVRRQQVEVPDYIEIARQLSAQWWHAPLAIESVAGFAAIPQILRRLDPNLRLIEVKMGADKFTRAQPVAAAWNGGRVLVPTSAPWLGRFLAEFERFTGVNDAEDDQVDALAHAWNALAEDVPTAAADISMTKESIWR